MLILSRGECEKIVIGGNITITVVRIGGEKVRLGIDAPANVSIVRSELLDQGKESHESGND